MRLAGLFALSIIFARDFDLCGARHALARFIFARGTFALSDDVECEAADRI